MNLIDCLKNKDICKDVINDRDFLRTVYLFDLIDLNKLNQEQLDLINNYKENEYKHYLENVEDYWIYNDWKTLKVVPIRKTQITKSTDPTEYIDNCFVCKILKRHRDYFDFIILDEESKTILVDFKLLQVELHGLIFISDLSDLLVANLNGYKVVSLEKTKENLLYSVKEKHIELLKDKYDYLYNQGKEQLTQQDLDNINNIVNVHYVLDTPYVPDKSKVNYLLDTNFSHFEDLYTFDTDIRRNYFVILYIRDKKGLLDMVKAEFNNVIDENSENTKHMHKIFCYYEVSKECNYSVKYYDFLKKDKELNIYRDMILAIKKAGETVNINKNSYENKINISDKPQYIYIGRKKGIHLCEIKEISYRNKKLFDIEEYNKSL